MVQRYHMDITLWAKGSGDGYGGFAFGSAQALKGRWEDKQELFLNAKNEEELSNAIVFFPSSYTPKIGDYLYNGTNVTADPTTVQEAFEVRQVFRTPDLRNVKMELRVVL